MVAQSPFVLIVKPALTVKTVQEFIAYARERPGQLSFGSGGPGSPHHLFAELFASMTGTKMTYVTYRGSVPALNDVVAGHIDFMFCDFASAAGMLQSDRVRPLGVSTAAAHPGLCEYSADQRGRRAGLRRGSVVHGGDDRQVAAGRRLTGCYGELKTILARPEVREQVVKQSLLPMDSKAGAGDAGVREVGDRALGQGGGGGRDSGIAVTALSRPHPEERSEGSRLEGWATGHMVRDALLRNAPHHEAEELS